MSTIVVPVYPSQLDAFKQKADLLADTIKQSLNIKVSKFKRYEYLALALGHKGHDRLIEHTKLIAQADKNEPLFVFTKEDVRKQLCDIFEDKYEKEISLDVAKILLEMGKEEAINNLPITSLDDIKKSSQEEVETVLGNANPNFNLYLDEVDTTPEAIEARHKTAENEAKLTPKRTNINVMIDLADVPEAIVKIITKHPKFLAFTNEVQQRNRFYNVRFDTLPKKTSNAVSKHWKIRAKFDSWSEAEPTSQLLELWAEFKDWLMSFYVTGRIQLAERINSNRITTIEMQYAVSDPVGFERKSLTSNTDLFLFDALCDVPAYETYHKDPEWARKTEKGMFELAKKHGRDNDLLLMNSNSGKAMDIEPYDGKVDFAKLASFGYRSVEPKSFYQNHLFNEVPITQPPKIHQIDIGQSMINGIKALSSAVRSKGVVHNPIISSGGLGKSKSNTLNPIANASPKQVTDLLLTITNQTLSNSDYALLEVTIKKLVSNNLSATILDCAYTIEPYPPFKNIAKALKTHYLGEPKYGQLFEASVGEVNVNNAIVSQENTGKSYYSEHIKSKNEKLEASITKENTADYLSLLAVHIPELKQTGMPNSDIPYHMMAFYDVPMSVTIKQLSKRK